MTRSQSLRSVLTASVCRNRRTVIFLFLSVAGSVAVSLLPPLVLERIVNMLAARRSLPFFLAAGYFLLLAASGLLDAARETLITVFGQKIMHNIRSAMSEKLLRLPASYYIKTESGVTASCFVNDVNAVDALFTSGIISMAADIFRLISILLVVFTRSIGLGLLLLAITPLLFVMTRRFQTRMLQAQLRGRAAVAQTNQQIPETLRNLRTVRILRQESFMQKRYKKSIDDAFLAQEQSNFYDAIYSPIVVFISSLLIGILMAASAGSGFIQSFFGMSAGTAAAMIAYIGNFFDPLEAIGMEIQNIQSAVAGIRRIRDFLDEPEIPETPNAFSAPADSGEPAVRFSSVTFRYETGERKILHDFNLAIRPGESVLFAGRTGAGKSTLFKLILGLYRPESGQIRVFGMAPDTLPAAKRRRIFGYVEQSFHRVPGSVADQISLYDPSVTETQMEQALQTVGLLDAVRALPAGLRTPCTGSLFSQGQFQLLSIARAIVCNPRLLLLDEITANLDSATETEVLAALSAAAKNRTVLSISHRIYEQTGGRMIQIGEMD